MPKNIPPRERLIVALDMPDVAQAQKLVDEIGDGVTFYKVGMELFAAAGNDCVRSLIDRGKRVFLDMKYYDIGETVKRAVAVAAKSGATFVTVHAVGQVMRRRVGGFGDRAQGIPLHECRADGCESSVGGTMVAVLRALEQSSGLLLVGHDFTVSACVYKHIDIQSHS